MNKPNLIPNCLNWFTPGVKPSIWQTKFTPVLALLAFVAGLLLALPASAQSITNIMTIKPWQVRLEVPSGFNGTVYAMTNNLRIPTNGASSYTLSGDGTNYWVIPSVTLSVSGAPSGCTASLVDKGLINPIGTITVTSLNITNSTASNTNLIVKLVFDGTQASGVTTLAIKASGAGLPDDVFPMPLEVAKIWNGNPDASINGADTWGNSAKWLGTGAPGPNDNVVFTDVGTQTNSLLFTVGTSTNQLTNCIIDTSTVISSLRFCQTNGIGTPKTNWHNLFLNPGVTLAIKGNDGFSLLHDYTFWVQPMNVSIFGTNGTLILTNESANFSILSDGQGPSVLDMSGLGSLYMDVNHVYTSDYLGYPNYLSLVYTNNFSGNTAGTGKPSRFYQTWRMALTNYIRAVYAGPDNYTNSLTRAYALTLGRNEASGGSSGANVEMFMGRTNSFFLDSMCIGGSFCLGADLRCLYTNSYAIFRNTNGGRMSIFSTADAGGPTQPASLGLIGDNTKCGGGPGVDFTRSTVDMLVDRLYLSMDRKNVVTSGKGISQTAFSFSSGIIDANTVVLGYQSEGTQTNQSYCYAAMFVTNTATLKVNGMLSLGYTTANLGDANLVQNGRGQLTIGPGISTVIASNIDIGGITKASGGTTGNGNNITMLNGATLIVSNTIGSAAPGGAVGNFAFGGNCTNKLFIDGSLSDPYVYATNLTTTGAGNTIYIGGLKNILSYPATLHLMAYVGATPPSFGLRMPPGFVGSGSLVPAATFPAGFNAGIDLVISTNPPKNLLWAGGNGVWDNTTKNWKDLNNSGTLTNFINGDNACFDDSSGSSISLDPTSSPLLPAAINMTNNTLDFVFNASAGADVEGSGAFNKWGTRNAQIDASLKIPVLLNQGTVTGSGTIYGASTAFGTTLTYGGTVNGSISVGGMVTFLNSSTISGQLTVLTNGIVLNDSPSVNLNGSLALQSGAYLTNTINGLIDNFTAGTVATNAMLANSGKLGDVNINNLTVNGTLQDMGAGDNDYLTVNTLTIGPGGLFLPGGNNLGVTTVFKTGPSGTGLFPGAILLQTGSSTLLQLNPVTPTNTVLLGFANSFGASSSRQTQVGATLILTNVTGSSFVAGQLFRLFANPNYGDIASTGTSTNTFPVIVPATPGPGLAWNLRYLWATTNGVNGYIGVVNANSGVNLTNSFSLLGGSNVVAQFSWPTADYGWRLQNLVSPMTNGLTPNTNYVWTGIDGSWTNTTMTITNKVDAANSVFYRLVFP